MHSANSTPALKRTTRNSRNVLYTDAILPDIGINAVEDGRENALNDFMPGVKIRILTNEELNNKLKSNGSEKTAKSNQDIPQKFVILAAKDISPELYKRVLTELTPFGTDNDGNLNYLISHELLNTWPDLCKAITTSSIVNPAQILESVAQKTLQTTTTKSSSQQMASVKSSPNLRRTTASDGVLNDESNETVSMEPKKHILRMSPRKKLQTAKAVTTDLNKATTTLSVQVKRIKQIDKIGKTSIKATETYPAEIKKSDASFTEQIRRIFYSPEKLKTTNTTNTRTQSKSKKNAKSTSAQVFNVLQMSPIKANSDITEPSKTEHRRGRSNTLQTSVVSTSTNTNAYQVNATDVKRYAAKQKPALQCTKTMANIETIVVNTDSSNIESEKTPDKMSAADSVLAKKTPLKKILILPKSVKIKNVDGKAVLETESGTTHILQIPKGMALKPIPKATAAIKACKEKVRIDARCTEDIQKCITQLTPNSSVMKIEAKSDNSCSTPAAELIMNRQMSPLDKAKKSPDKKSDTLSNQDLEISLSPFVTIRDPLEIDTLTEQYECLNEEDFIENTNVLTNEVEYEKLEQADKSTELFIEEANVHQTDVQTYGCGSSYKMQSDKPVQVMNFKEMYKPANSLTYKIAPAQPNKKFIYKTLRGLINYDEINDEFTINCFYCTRIFALYLPMDFEDHIRNEHANEEPLSNDQQLLCDKIINHHNNKKEFVNSNGRKKQKQSEESKSVQKARQENNSINSAEEVTNILSNIDEDLNHLLKLNITTNETLNNSDIIEEDMSNADDVDGDDISQIDDAEKLNSSNFKRESRKRQFCWNDTADEMPRVKKSFSAPTEEEEDIFPSDGEEDDVPKPTNGNGIVFGITNRAVVMDFLQFFKTHSKLWETHILSNAADYEEERSELEELCAQLNEKWHINITMEEIQTSLKRIIRWFSICLQKALFNVQRKMLSEPRQSEYFDICLHLTKEVATLSAEIEEYLTFRQVLLDVMRNGKRTYNRKQKMVTCNVCGKVERSPLAMSKHKRFHKPPQVQCTMCPKMFFQKHVMEQHVRSQHLNILNFMCEMCGKAFRSQHYLHLHQKADHWQIRYTCVVCDHSFKERRNLTAHQVKYHVPMVGEWWECANTDPMSSDEGKNRPGRRSKNIEPGIKEILKEPTLEVMKWRKNYPPNPISKRFYGCFKCRQQFESFKELRRHNRSKHYLPDDMLLNCKMCHISVQHPLNIVRHYVSKHNLSKLEATRLYHTGRKELADKIAQETGYKEILRLRKTPEKEDENAFEPVGLVDDTLEEDKLLELEQMVQQKLQEGKLESFSFNCEMCYNFNTQDPFMLKSHYFKKHKITNFRTNRLYHQTLMEVEEKLNLQLEVQQEDEEEEMVEVEVEETDQDQLIETELMKPLVFVDEQLDDVDFDNIICEDPIEQEIFEEYEVIQGVNSLEIHR